MSAELKIPSTFENFKQRELTMGTETTSLTNYKGFEIIMRAYRMSGIKYIIKKDGKKVRSRHVNFADPYSFLQHAKDWIDFNPLSPNQRNPKGEPDK